MPPPTAPRPKPFPKARPQVIITTPPPRASPPNPFTNLKRSVKRDANNAIIGVIGYPLFASAVTSICAIACAFPGSGGDRARYLGTMQLRFADQADFTRISEQKILVEALLATLPTIDRRVGDNALDVKAFILFADAILQIETNRREVQRKRELEECQRRQRVDEDVAMTGPSPAKPVKRKANVSLAHHFTVLSKRLDLLMLAVSSSVQTEPAGKPRPKKLKIDPAAAVHKPGSDEMLSLLNQVDGILETAQLSEDASTARDDLEKHRNAVELAVQQQLYHLDISLQTFRLLSDRLARLTKALGPSEVDQTGSLLHALQVSTETPADDSDIEFQEPNVEDSEDAVDVQAAAAL
ncbi:hypothetical protein C0992_007590 [Termitomyces sp. T32_za158]|nr:hypothetical protein C0992_007590 [Termitomyces sp. T32_za158]